MKEIVIANLGIGNLISVKHAVKAISDSHIVNVTDSPEMINNADYLILPGQGSIRSLMHYLKIHPELEKSVKNRLNDSSSPVLGICLGLHILLNYSEENGGTEGIGIFHGTVRHFSNLMYFNSLNRKHPYKVPHMGWNVVNQKQPHPLWYNIVDGERFYFAHSYYVDNINQKEVTGEFFYGNMFTAALAKKNLFATQFHPEKSQSAGLQLLKNFINWNGAT